jgi:hypothetical protein
MPLDKHPILIGISGSSIHFNVNMEKVTPLLFQCLRTLAVIPAGVETLKLLAGLMSPRPPNTSLDYIASAAWVCNSFSCPPRLMISIEHSDSVPSIVFHNRSFGAMATLLPANCHTHSSRRATSDMLARYLLYSSSTTIRRRGPSISLLVCDWNYDLCSYSHTNAFTCSLLNR